MPAAPLLLASESPRRAALLAAWGVAFTAVPSQVEEGSRNGETPPAHVRRLAVAKAVAVSAQHPDRWVLGADTVVVLDHEILGKPRDAPDAEEMLARLSGRTHTVWTGVALVREGQVLQHEACASQVHFRVLSLAAIRRYVAIGEPMDKAGAYAVQSAVCPCVDWIDGSWSNVVGLPQEMVVPWLHAVGLLAASGTLPREHS